MATSTMEAEYIPASDVVKEALWLSRLAVTFQQADSNKTPVVLRDSQGVVALARNPVHHNASKHIEVRYHFIRECVTRGQLSLEKFSKADNVVDAMTKCLPMDHFWFLRDLMVVEGTLEQ